MTKAEDTREKILERAVVLARHVGLEGVTLGTLATETGLSKSGLYAHFQSKEDLQLEIIKLSAEQFADEVFRPAIQEPRGLPRVQAVFWGWMEWVRKPGGCVFIAASSELDDRPGPLRDELVRQQKLLLESLERSAQLAIAEGHFRRGLDTAQFAFELDSILVGYSHLHRLIADPRAETRARKAFEALIARSLPAQS